MSIAVAQSWRVLDAGPIVPGDARHLLMRLLRLRGISSAAASRPFLFPDVPTTFALPNLDAGAERLAHAVRSGERVAIYGDYDADGTTATALLVEGLQTLGLNAIPYIPHRFDEGYGLNTSALSALRDRGVSLVVTVDTGTSAPHEIAYATEREMDVIVADHHLPKGELPQAVAVVNPWLAGGAPELTDLSGCGVAYALLLATADRLGTTVDRRQPLDLVAIGAVCDVMSLNGVNRALVKAGVARLRDRARPGLTALMDVAGVTSTRASAEDIGFRIGPRLNAAGRVDHAMLAFQLLTATDSTHARSLAQQIEQHNRRRQELTAEAITIAESLMLDEAVDAPLVMVGDARIHQGVVGLVASRLAEHYNRPAVVYHQGDRHCVGSARGVPSVDVHAMLEHSERVLVRYGGHAQAGGFTILTSRIGELRDALTEYLTVRTAAVVPPPELTVELELPLGSAPPDPQLLALLDQVEPCGRGNQQPQFLARGVQVCSTRLVGDGRHLQLRLRDPASVNRRIWKAIAFRQSEAAPPLGSLIDIAFTVQAGWSDQAELRLLAFHPSGR